MTPYPKRLIEVDLPIKRISAHARREKSIRHGHISTLHIWWARRPLAACRAVVCAALWPDPADPLCPPAFRDVAARAITAFAAKVIYPPHLRNSCSPESLSRWEVLAKPESALDLTSAAHQNLLRFALLDFIADFANWDNSTVPEYLETARALTQAAHEALGGEPGTRPLVVDPFAGGGSIPLEALRVGADAFASDLNPVAVLLNKVVLEYIPKYGQRMAEEVRKWGKWVKEHAEKELAPFYPKDPDGATPIAYLWARTITCEGPGCGAEVPLIRSLWLARKGNRSVALRMVPRPKLKRLDFEIMENAKAKEVGDGTVRRGSATCPVCGFTTPVASVRRQLKERRGGAADSRLFCVVTTRPGQKGRFYRLPTDLDLKSVRRAVAELEGRKKQHKEPLSLVPDEPTPPGGGRGAGRAFSQRNYGMDTFGDLFTPRQLLTLTVLTRLVREAGAKIAQENQDELALASHLVLALCASKLSDLLNSLCGWQPSNDRATHLFARQAIQITWDFAESTGAGDAVGNFGTAINNMNRILKREAEKYNPGHVERTSADSNPLPDGIAQMFFTDPPYYDAVPYADLSDFFYVWIKRAFLPSAVSSQPHELTPKREECIVDEVKGKDNKYFQSTMNRALQEGRRVLSPQGIGVIVFAHKTTLGWEAQLQALVDAGWTITGSWPIDTEWETRLRAINSAALASSVHLVSRFRGTELVGDWRDVLTELPKRTHEWLPRLASEGIVGADSIFACLGPALEIFSRYSKVEKANGELVQLREYLEHVWAAVAKEALSMIFAGADATGFDPDARLTAIWFWTLSTESAGNGKPTEEEAEDEQDEEAIGKQAKGGGYVLEYDAARKIAQGLGAHLEQLNRVVEVKGDKASLLSVSERAKYLFGKDEGKEPPKRSKKPKQATLFDEPGEGDGDGGGWGEVSVPKAGATVLDRLHQGMILFAAGRSEALKRFLVEEGVGLDTRFWRLAQALSALYPPGTEEKRWVDGVLARKKGLGF
jgi:adenine-specific DNA methylase